MQKINHIISVINNNRRSLERRKNNIFMSNLVKKIKWNLSNQKLPELFVYDEASVEANNQMQEPLKKLYEYEKQPNMREKVKEYITELKEEIKRVEKCIIDNGDNAPDTNNMLLARIQTLQEVIYDLQGKMEEVL